MTVIDKLDMTLSEVEEGAERVESVVDTIDSERCVRTSATFDDTRYHLHQLVIETVDNDVSGLFDDSDDIEWIVVGLDGGLELATPGFSEREFVPAFRVDGEKYVPQAAESPHHEYDIPIFAY